MKCLITLAVAVGLGLLAFNAGSVEQAVLRAMNAKVEACMYEAAPDLMEAFKAGESDISLIAVSELRKSC